MINRRRSGYQPTEVSFSLAGPLLSIAPFVLESDLLRIAGNADATHARGRSELFWSHR